MVSIVNGFHCCLKLNKILRDFYYILYFYLINELTVALRNYKLSATVH